MKDFERAFVDGGDWDEGAVLRDLVAHGLSENSAVRRREELWQLWLARSRGETVNYDEGRKSVEGDKAKSEMFALIPRWAFPVFMELSDKGKRVIVSLALHRNKKTGLAFPSVETIMAETNLPNEREVYRGLEEVRESGLIRKAPGKEGQGWRGHSPRWVVFAVGKGDKATVTLIDQKGDKHPLENAAIA